MGKITKRSSVGSRSGSLGGVRGVPERSRAGGGRSFDGALAFSSGELALAFRPREPPPFPPREADGGRLAGLDDVESSGTDSEGTEGAKETSILLGVLSGEKGTFIWGTFGTLAVANQI